MAIKDGKIISNRGVKDSAFTAYFGNPENASRLYAALGEEEVSPEKILRLSDAFLEKTEHPMLELEVKFININLPSGHKLLKECRPMYEYSRFIQQIKEYLCAGWARDEAITQAVMDCREAFCDALGKSPRISAGALRASRRKKSCRSGIWQRPQRKTLRNFGII